MAGETRKPTARRGRATTRTKKLAPPVEAASAPAGQPPVTAPPVAKSDPEPIVDAHPSPPPEPRDWVPVVYEGEGVFSDGVAGVFVTGTRTRLRAPVAARLLRLDGFRLAG